jgi:hypothetical protein
VSARVHIVDRDSLNALMDFDHPIEILGQVVNYTASDAFPPTFAAREGDTSIRANRAPELREGELNPADMAYGWKLHTGASGQQGYSGPIMHDSEYIGGGLADHILASAPGTRWCALINYVDTPNEMCSIDCDPEAGCDHDIAGWAVAYREVSA